MALEFVFGAVCTRILHHFSSQTRLEWSSLAGTRPKIDEHYIYIYICIVGCLASFEPILASLVGLGPCTLCTADRP